MEKDLSLNYTILYALGIIGICFCVFSVTKCSSTPELTQALETCQTSVTVVLKETGKHDGYDYLEKFAPAVEATNKCREYVTGVFKKENSINRIMPQ